MHCVSLNVSIQNPANVFSYLISQMKGEAPAQILKQIVNIYDNVKNRQNVVNWCHEFNAEEQKFIVNNQQKAVSDQ